jgi:hypothetical protein
MSNAMAFKDLYSINNYFGSQTIERFSGYRRNLSNRIPSNEGNGFKSILSSLQTQPSKNVFKTKGLTIADYRTRPVISKSRHKPYAKLASTQLKNAGPNRVADQGRSPVIGDDSLQTRSRSSQKIKACGYIKMPQSKANQQKTESTTTRTAGGLDFTAIGGKRQGRQVPQSLKTTRWTVDSRAKHPVWKTQLTEQQIIDQNVQKAAAKYDLSPALIKGLIRAESNFKVRAVSSAGAQGLMQLMPATAEELGVKNPFDIEQNIDGGTKYLRKMLDRFGGNVRKALAAYNAGPGTVIKYNGRVPYPETRQYVRRVLRFSRQMA